MIYEELYFDSKSQALMIQLNSYKETMTWPLKGTMGFIRGYSMQPCYSIRSRRPSLTFSSGIIWAQLLQIQRHVGVRKIDACELPEPHGAKRPKPKDRKSHNHSLVHRA